MAYFGAELAQRCMFHFQDTHLILLQLLLTQVTTNKEEVSIKVTQGGRSSNAMQNLLPTGHSDM
jgi:hypothetical protein